MIDIIAAVTYTLHSTYTVNMSCLCYIPRHNPISPANTFSLACIIYSLHRPISQPWFNYIIPQAEMFSHLKKEVVVAKSQMFALSGKTYEYAGFQKGKSVRQP